MCLYCWDDRCLVVLVPAGLSAVMQTEVYYMVDHRIILARTHVPVLRAEMTCLGACKVDATDGWDTAVKWCQIIGSSSQAQ
jgi:hypothetical protein